MATLLSTLQFWSQSQDLKINDVDVSCSSYHEKGEVGIDQSYYEDKKVYFESRGFTWTLPNKRPDKLRDALRDFEELCFTHRCIKVEWKNQFLIQSIFNNGTIVNIVINVLTGDIEKLSFDKYLIGKLHSDNIVDVAFDEDSFYFSSVEPKLNRVLLNKKMILLDECRKIEKLNSYDPKTIVLDLLGPAGRRLERKLSTNVNNDFLLVWWQVSSNEVWPWTPLITEKERANLQVYNINGSRFELACYCRTDMEPLMAAFSKIHAHHIVTIEQKLLHTGEIFVERCIYEVTMTKLQRVASTSIPVNSQVVCQAQNSQEDRLLIGCENCSLVLFDEYRRSTNTSKVSFIPSIIAWHPNGTLVLVGSEFGQIQCFDQALTYIKFQLLADEYPHSFSFLDLSQYFKQPPILQKLIWNSAKTSSCGFQSTDRVIAVFDRGPFVVINFQLGILNRGSLTPAELIVQYIKHRQLDEAVSLLSSLNWNVDAQLCYYCLTYIVNHLLRMPFNATVDSQLETALGTFYAPVRPLTKVVILEYRDRLVNLARKFFHHLLRHEKLEKASLLAVDIGSRDLFRDLYYVALSKGDNILAEVALRNARDLEEGSITSEESGDSVDESNDGSEYSDSSYSSDSDGNCNENVSSRVTVVDKQAPFKHTKSRYNSTSDQEKFHFVSPSELKIQPALKLQSAKQSLPHLMNTSPTIKSAAIVPTTAERQIPSTQKIPAVATRQKTNDTASAQYQYTQLTTSNDHSLLSLKPDLIINSCTIDPNEQSVDGDITQPAETDDDESSGTVKVVHFGIV